MGPTVKRMLAFTHRSDDRPVRLDKQISRKGLRVCEVRDYLPVTFGDFIVAQRDRPKSHR